MSAFVCDERTINRVLFAVSELRRKGVFREDFDFEKMGQEFVDFNVESVNHRYSHHEAEKPFKFRYKKVYPTFIQALKSLHCLMYQCSELPDYDQHDSYKMMQRLERVLSKQIIQELPEYDKADWD